jgi:hypothetical protein
MEKLDLYDARDRNKRFQQQKNLTTSPQTLVSRVWILNPLDQVVFDFYKSEGRRTGLGEMWNPGWGLGPLKRVTGIYFDFLPTGQDSMDLFVMRKSRIGIWHGKAQWSDAAKQWKMAWSQEEERIDIDFHEPFIVYGNDAAYYFLLPDSGRLYVARKPKSGERAADPVYARDPSMPIGIVIHDCASGKTFYFVLPEKRKSEGRYFDMQGKESGFYQWNVFENIYPDDPCSTVGSCARILLHDKKIK